MKPSDSLGIGGRIPGAAEIRRAPAGLDGGERPTIVRASRRQRVASAVLAASAASLRGRRFGLDYREGEHDRRLPVLPDFGPLRRA